MDMKKINLTLILLFSVCFLSCNNKENQPFFLLFDSTDHLLKKDINNRIWLFKDENHLKKWETTFNYKEGDYSKQEYIHLNKTSSSSCPPILSLIDEKKISLDSFNKMKTYTRKEYLKLKKKSQPKFLVQRVSKDSFLVAKIFSSICQ